jgi:hypothetical protein
MSKPKVVLIDIDGVIARKHGAGNPSVAEPLFRVWSMLEPLILDLHLGVIFVTGRPESELSATHEWVNDVFLPNVHPHILKDSAGPLRLMFLQEQQREGKSNAEIKEIILSRILRDYDPILAVDDNESAAFMYRHHGIQSFYVVGGGID